METTIKKLPRSQLEILVSLSEKDFDEFYKKSLFELAKDLEISGFRKGKIPSKLIEERIGKEKILNLAKEKAIKECYFKIIEEKKFEVLGRPKIELLKEEKPFSFKILISVYPEIKLPDYKKIASQKKKREISVSEKEVEETLLYIQKSRAKFFPKNSPAEKGDFVEIEYSSPQINLGRKIKDSFFLGKGGFVEGFEKNLEGMRSGEEKVFTIKISKDYFRKEIAGKELTFKVKTISVQKVEIPKLDDEFAKSLGRFKNLNDLKKSVFEGILMEKEKAESERIREEILEEIIKNSQFEVPEILIEEEKKRCLEELKVKIPKLFNISFQDYLNQIKKTEQEIENSYYKEAKERVKRALIIKEIKKREKIEATQEEVLEMANKILSSFTLEEAKKIDPELLKEYTKERIEEEKVLNFLEAQVK